MVLPMLAFSLNGYNDEKITLIINEAISFPDSTSYEGGYDIIGTLEIYAGSYHVFAERYFFATGTLYRFSEELQDCYSKLEGIATYKMFLENELDFSVEMTGRGHAKIIGSYQERPDINNILQFEIETDQSCFKSVIQDIKNVKKTFGGYQGIRK